MGFNRRDFDHGKETDWPRWSDPDNRAAASADPYAGTNAANGKPIWDVETINENLNRTEQDWYTGNYGELDDGVLNYGFWTNINQLINSYYVDETGTYAFNEVFYFSAFTPAQTEMARKAIALWDDLVAIRFEETPVADADITYGNTWTGGAQAYAYLPFGDVYDSYYQQIGFNEIGRLSGDVWVDGYVASNFFPTGDSWYSQITLIHETGHALGLSHPGDYDALDDNDGDGVPDPITYANDAAFFQDSLQYSVMSYFDAYETGAQHIDWELLSFGYASTPLLHDVSAIQAIYGADPTTRTGNTTYGFNSNAGRSAYDFSANRVPIVTIYDAGGKDTLDLSGFNTPSLIDLNPGAFSSAGGIEEFLTLEEVNANRAALGLPARDAAAWAFYEGIKETYGLENGLFTDNISIAYGTWIENAKGGGGDDIIVGNAVANVLDGGGGIDTVSYRGASAGVTINMASLTGTGGDAAGDKYISIEHAEGSKFADTITGGNSDDGLAGLAGDDTLSGGNGEDSLDGGDGNDTLTGGNHNDTLAGGAGNDVLDGGNHEDTLLGGDGNDSLSGGNQSDWLNGGAGNDTLLGGNQNDVFAFSDLGGTDVVSDFRRGQDKIDLSAIDAVTGGSDNAFSFIGASAFSGVAGQLRSFSSAGNYFVTGDVDGNGVADFTIQTNLLVIQADLVL